MRLKPILGRSGDLQHELTQTIQMGIMMGIAIFAHWCDKMPLKCKQVIQVQLHPPTNLTKHICAVSVLPGLAGVYHTDAIRKLYKTTWLNSRIQQSSAWQLEVNLIMTLLSYVKTVHAQNLL